MILWHLCCSKISLAKLVPLRQYPVQLNQLRVVKHRLRLRQDRQRQLGQVPLVAGFPPRRPQLARDGSTPLRIAFLLKRVSEQISSLDTLTIHFGVCQLIKDYKNCCSFSTKSTQYLKVLHWRHQNVSLQRSVLLFSVFL